nr:radical SAM protein [uncultured Desulfobacter sp.]
MSNSEESLSIGDLSLWKRAKKQRALLSIVMDLTARCNNNCVHCYINREAGDQQAIENELSLDQIKNLTDQAIKMDVLWVLLSGGEPLLRPDFPEIYTYIRTRGILVSLFTNASLISADHIYLFKKYPPRQIEVSVYATTADIHRKVTRKNTFESTMRGIDRLLSAGLPVTLKSTIIKANLPDFDGIADFCRAKSKQPFRFDPFLQLRADKNPERNMEILAQRLTPAQIVALEKKDPDRRNALEQTCQNLLDQPRINPDPLFRCQAGINTCAISWDGRFQLCPSLVNPDCTLDLRTNTLAHAWNHFTPGIIALSSTGGQYKATCGSCDLHDICSWCPAHADLETNRLDGHIPYFCDVAKARQKI